MLDQVASFHPKTQIQRALSLNSIEHVWLLKPPVNQNSPFIRYNVRPPQSFLWIYKPIDGSSISNRPANSGDSTWRNVKQSHGNRHGSCYTSNWIILIPACSYDIDESHHPFDSINAPAGWGFFKIPYKCLIISGWIPCFTVEINERSHYKGYI